MRVIPAFKGEFQTATNGFGQAFLRLENVIGPPIWYMATPEGWHFVGNLESGKMESLFQKEQ